MAASVQVLCPNGRRQNVKINPNTKLLQILEEVCQRQGYIPPEDYKLVQGRKELDLSLSVRFSSIPNNAKLELSKAASARIEQDVTIALQLDSGQRLQDSFKPCATLWDILLHFESKDSEYEGVLSRIDTRHVPSLHPVCIFMREEVIGEKALQAMTLKKLGLTSGKAIIRLLHRPVEASFLQDIVDNLEKERQKQVKLEEIALKKCELRQIDEMERNRRLDDASLSTLDEEKMDETEASLVSLRSASSQVTEVGPSHPELMEQGANESLSSSTTASDSTSGKPRGQRSKKNSSISQSQDQVSATSAINDLRNMNIPGVEIFTPDEFSDLSPQEQAIARRLAERFLPHLQTVHSTISAVSEGSEESSFADFKFPEETRGMDLTRSDLESISEERFAASESACERETIVYRTEETFQPELSSSDNSIPEDFFEVTQSDIRVMYRDLQNAVKQFEDQPLMTKAMRQAQTEALYDHYDKVVIRVQFPEKLTLQGVFRPREPVAALYSFVKAHIKNEKLSFYLYTSPPKEVLKDKKSSLAANRLAPAVIVYFGSDVQTDSYLKDEMRGRIKPRSDAEKVVMRILKPSFEDRVGGSDERVNVPRESGGAQASTSNSYRRSQASSFPQANTARLPSGAQLPKWLTLGKK